MPNLLNVNGYQESLFLKLVLKYFTCSIYLGTTCNLRHKCSTIHEHHLKSNKNLHFVKKLNQAETPLKVPLTDDRVVYCSCIVRSVTQNQA